MRPKDWTVLVNHYDGEEALNLLEQLLRQGVLCTANASEPTVALGQASVYLADAAALLKAYREKRYGQKTVQVI